MTADEVDAKPVDPNDPKEKFRQALAAKQAKSAAPPPHAEASGTGGSDHASGRAGGKREFRRKSG
jgi:hypothetical protein